jgi:hypothetical protein
MNEAPRLAVRIKHGEHCSCKLLALAVGLDPRALSYEYCRRVLQRRWRMTCRHGECASDLVATGLGERWRGVASVDPVKAILISNDQRDE